MIKARKGAPDQTRNVLQFHLKLKELRQCYRKKHNSFYITFSCSVEGITSSETCMAFNVIRQQSKRFFWLLNYIMTKAFNDIMNDYYDELPKPMSDHQSANHAVD
ncbi:hypothetical protein CEXT_457671 [Caerostris extrusa]|uniref:Uncharacterized protein n=1 Tax=Caerostris extrusa TaxID=172846 RepID=A0AAV4NV02_CAEEX|nr:hypothetical protein CEXT_457671 [Caerostris extrusa]